MRDFLIERRMKMDYPPTKIEVRIAVLVKTGDFSNFRIEIGVEDYKRETEKNTEAGIERIYKLVADKVVEKVKELDPR